MINTQKIFDLLQQALTGQDLKHIVRGSFKGLPHPPEFTNLASGDKFAVIRLAGITPEYSGSRLWSPVYHYEIHIMQKEITGDVTQTRDELCSIAGDFNANLIHGNIINKINLIDPENMEAASEYNATAIRIDGDLTMPDRMTGQIREKKHSES